jgi:hypothetical protein
VGPQMGGVGVSSGGSEHSTSVLDVGGMAGRVATAASATVSGVVGMMGGGGGLSLQGSAMKLQWCVACSSHLSMVSLSMVRCFVVLTSWIKRTHHPSLMHTYICWECSASFRYVRALYPSRGRCIRCSSSKNHVVQASLSFVLLPHSTSPLSLLPPPIHNPNPTDSLNLHNVHLHPRL